MAELWLVASLILGAIFGLLFLLSSRNIEEDEVEEILDDWDLQDQLEEFALEEEIEDEQDAQDLMDILFLNDDEDMI